MENLQLLSIAETTLNWVPSVSMLWLATMGLLASTLFLLTYTFFLSYYYTRYEKMTKRFEQSLLPALFQYLDGEIGRETLSQLVGENKIKCKVFENTILRLLKNLEGEEAAKLRSALAIKPVFNYHLNQLNSRHIDLKIKACLYFRHIELQEPSIIRLLKNEVNSEKTFLAFSAASALMGSPDLTTKGYALKTLSKNQKLSGMAIMEMFHRFRNEENNNATEEHLVLKDIISDSDLPSENRAVLIRCAAESRLYHLSETFHEWLKSEEKMWTTPEVLAALIDSQRIFVNLDASNDIIRHIYHSDRKVARAAEAALGEITIKDFAPEGDYRIS